MSAIRQLFTLLLLAALLAPPGLRVGGNGCAPMGPGHSEAAALAGQVPDPARSDSCRSHHPGHESLPRGAQHCVLSLDCVSGPALADSRSQGPDQTTAMAVPSIVMALPPTDSPEPQAPPPRS